MTWRVWEQRKLPWKRSRDSGPGWRLIPLLPGWSLHPAAINLPPVLQLLSTLPLCFSLPGRLIASIFHSGHLSRFAAIDFRCLWNAATARTCAIKKHMNPVAENQPAATRREQKQLRRRNIFFLTELLLLQTSGPTGQRQHEASANRTGKRRSLKPERPIHPRRTGLRSGNELG